MENFPWLSVVSAIVGVLGTTVVAVATTYLWLVTKNLTMETRRLADASSQPHIVATIAPNHWSMMHADLRVDNTGNATAYDIHISFDPPLESGKIRGSEATIPFQRVSVLKPGQGLSSYLSEFVPLHGKTYTVTVSWRRNPAKDNRDTNTYTLNVGDMEGVSRLGASDPLTQIAEDVKKMREGWARVAGGSQRIQADVFASGDRLHEQRQRDRWRRETLRKQVDQKAQQARLVEKSDADPPHE